MHGKADRHMKLLTLERESSLGSLWDQEQCAQFCSKDELWESVKEEEMKIPWKEVQEGLPVPEDQYQERFWRRRLHQEKVLWFNMHVTDANMHVPAPNMRFCKNPMSTWSTFS